MQLIESWSHQNNYKAFKRAIEGENPDLVMSVHPVCQAIPITVVQEMNKDRDKAKPRIPFITVVTDLGGCHNSWFDKRVDACFVPSKAVYKLALRNYVPREKIKLRGLPIRPAFWTVSQTKSEARKSLGLRENSSTVMLMGGGDGVGWLQSIATEL
eukprot:gene34200-42169_t